MVVQPLLDERALNSGAQEARAEPGLFAAMHSKTPVLMQESGMPQGSGRGEGAGEASLGGAIDVVIGSRPPIEVDDAFFALVPFNPFPGDGEGKGCQPSMDHLETIKAGTIDGEMEGAGSVDRQFAIKSDSNRPCGDGKTATQNVKEAEGAKDSCKFAPVG